MNYLKSNKFFLIYTFIFFTILTPPIFLKPLPSIRLEQIFLIFFFIYLLINSIITKKNQIPLNKAVITISSFTVIILISIFVGFLKGYNIIFNDFFEIFKIFIYVLTMIFIFKMPKTLEFKMKILNAISISIFISALISITQYFDLFGINEYYLPKIAPTQYITLVDNYPYPRVIGISANPNVYGALLTMGIMITLILFLYNKRKYNFLILLTNLMTLFMTLSRTSFIFILIVLFCFTILYFQKSLFKDKNIFKISTNLILAFIIFTIAVIIILNLIPQELSWRIESLLNITEQRSFIMRIERWSGEFENIFKNPIFGRGPVKSLKSKLSIDSEWLLLVKRYGIVGTIYFISMFIVPFRNKRINETMIGKVYISLAIGIIVYMIPAAFYHSFQLMTIFMVIYALAFEKDVR